MPLWVFRCSQVCKQVFIYAGDRGIQLDPALTIQESLDLLDEIPQFLIGVLQPGFCGIGVVQGRLSSLLGHSGLCFRFSYLAKSTEDPLVSRKGAADTQECKGLSMQKYNRNKFPLLLTALRLGLHGMP